jgi:hypothetical protein
MSMLRAGTGGTTTPSSMSPSMVGVVHDSTTMLDKRASCSACLALLPSCGCHSHMGKNLHPRAC